MRKTFCDRHNTECTSRIGRLNLSVIHQTNKHEIVSEDDYKTMDLCGECIDEIVNIFFGGSLPLSKSGIGEDIPVDSAIARERTTIMDQPVWTP